MLFTISMIFQLETQDFHLNGLVFLAEHNKILVKVLRLDYHACK